MSRSGQWEVFRRCIAIITRLESGPATRQELIHLAYPHVPPSAVQKRFENDLNRLRNSLDVEIVYERSDRVYRLGATGLVPLLDLPDAAIQGLVFLGETFENHVPQSQHIQALVDSLTALLPQERRTELMRIGSSLAIDLRQRDPDEIDEDVWRKLEMAYLHQRLVQFLYISPQNEDQKPRRHLVEVRSKLRFDTARGHWYLRGYCQRVEGPNGKWTPKKYLRYRIGRILPRSVEILPERFPATPPAVRMLSVKYRLSPAIARLGVSEHFENQQVVTCEDGSAIVCAETDDLFDAMKTLLFYGENCEVLGGEELLAAYRETITAMWQKVRLNHDSPTDMG